MQRDLGRTLQIERSTVTGLVATLVRKGLVDQTFSLHDQRQRVLRRTDGNTT
jgi:DNA-binding MarR family transcriptional regulator